MRVRQVPAPSSKREPRWRQTLAKARITPSLPRMTMAESRIMSSVAKAPGCFSWLTWQTNCQDGRISVSYSSAVSSALQ
jgi:hypothetical protein